MQFFKDILVIFSILRSFNFHLLCSYIINHIKKLFSSNFQNSQSLLTVQFTSNQVFKSIYLFSEAFHINTHGLEIHSTALYLNEFRFYTNNNKDASSLMCFSPPNTVTRHVFTNFQTRRLVHWRILLQHSRSHGSLKFIFGTKLPHDRS